MAYEFRDVEHLESVVASLRLRIDALEKEVTSSKTSIRDVKRRIDAVDTHRDALNNDYRALKAEQDDIKTKIEDAVVAPISVIVESADTRRNLITVREDEGRLSLSEVTEGLGFSSGSVLEGEAGKYAIVSLDAGQNGVDALLILGVIEGDFPEAGEVLELSEDRLTGI